MVYIYSNKAYHKDEDFTIDVGQTYDEAYSKEHHIELLEEIYPDMTVIPLWTYEHNCLIIETYCRDKFDSSADGFAVYNDREEFEDELRRINKELKYDN